MRTGNLTSMDDHEPLASPVDPDATAPVPYEPTGVAEIDEVLAEVAALAELSASAHVEVFERAHERLRRALDVRADA